MYGTAVADTGTYLLKVQIYSEKGPCIAPCLFSLKDSRSNLLVLNLLEKQMFVLQTSQANSAGLDSDGLVLTL